MILRGTEAIAKYMNTSMTAVSRMIKDPIRGSKFPAVKLGKIYFSESSLVDKFIISLVEKST